MAHQVKQVPDIKLNLAMRRGPLFIEELDTDPRGICNQRPDPTESPEKKEDDAAAYAVAAAAKQEKEEEEPSKKKVSDETLKSMSSVELADLIERTRDVKAKKS